MCTLWPSRRQDISIPGSSVSPAGRAARASWWPATVSWSVSAITSSPAAWACRTTSAGGSVPSDAVLWLCRSARTLATLAGKPRRRRPERQVQVLARVAQVSELQRLDQQHSGRSRPQHQPEPGAHHHSGKGSSVGRHHFPERKPMVAELDESVGRPGREIVAGGGAPEPGAPGDEACAEFLRRQQHLAGAADRIRPGQGDDAAARAGALVARAGEPGDEPAKRQRPREPERDVRAAQQGFQALPGQAEPGAQWIYLTCRSQCQALDQAVGPRTTASQCGHVAALFMSTDRDARRLSSQVTLAAPPGSAGRRCAYWARGSPARALRRGSDHGRGRTAAADQARA